MIFLLLSKIRLFILSLYKTLIFYFWDRKWKFSYFHDVLLFFQKYFTYLMKTPQFFFIFGNLVYTITFSQFLETFSTLPKLFYLIPYSIQFLFLIFRCIIWSSFDFYGFSVFRSQYMRKKKFIPKKSSSSKTSHIDWLHAMVRWTTISKVAEDQDASSIKFALCYSTMDKQI